MAILINVPESVLAAAVLGILLVGAKLGEEGKLVGTILEREVLRRMVMSLEGLNGPAERSAVLGFPSERGVAIAV